MSPWTFHQELRPHGEEELEQLAAGMFSFGAGAAAHSEKAGEEDICRVCRGEATLDMPLMHPW
jgi:hypothetical protein